MRSKSNFEVKFLLISLLLGVFVSPSPVAKAVDLVTKTFTVRGADNSLLAGAQVRFNWDDPVTGAQVIGDPVTTNASGVAVLTAPLNASYLQYTVFPAVNDRQNALQGDTAISSSADGTVSVKLEAPNIFLNIQKSDGSNVSGGAVLTYPTSADNVWNRNNFQGSNSGYASVIRSGPVGLKIASNLNPSSDYVFGLLQFIENYQPGQFSFRYGLKAAGSSGSQTYTVYGNPAFTGSPLSPIDGVYTLRYSAANIIGTLKNNDGSNFVMSTGMTLSTNLSVVDVPGSDVPYPPHGSADFTDYIKSPNGNWFARGLGGAGKYQLTFIFGGSATVPSFTTYIWKNSSGGWSLNENGPFSGNLTTPANIEVTRPATPPNVVLTVRAKDTNVDLPSTVQVEKKVSGDTYTYVSNPRLLNGKFAGILPDGEYRLRVFANDQSYSQKTFQVIITSNSVSSFKDQYGNDVVPTAGAYILSIPGPNISGTFKDSNGNNLIFGQNQSIDLQIQKKVNGNWQWIDNYSYQTSANWKMNIDEVGEFRMIARPSGFDGISESYSASFWVAEGNPKKLSTVDAASAAAGNTTALTGLNITMRTSNLKMSITNPKENSLLKYGWVSIQKKMENGDQIWIGNADIRFNNPGLADIRLDDGNYRLEVNPLFNGVLISGLSRKYYDATVSNSGNTVTVCCKSDGTALAADSSGRFALQAAKANLSGKIADSNGTPLGGSNQKWVSINVQKYVESRNQFDWTSNWANTDQNGDFSISLTDPGKYRLRIQPNGFANASIFYSQEFTLVSGTEEIDFKTMKSPLPALSGFVYEPGSSVGVRDARVRAIDLVTNQELWQNEAFTSSTGAWAMTLPQGSYAIYAAAPYGSTTFGNSDNLGTVNVDINGVATLSGSAQSGRTPSAFNISLKSPTWKGVVKNPQNNGNVPYAQVCLMNDQKWNCTDSNANGEWALSAPAGFSGFMPGSFVQIADWRGRAYPQRRYDDASAALGGLTSQNVNLAFQTANVSITVLGNGNQPLRDVWVSLIQPNKGWLAGNNTNSSGVATMSISETDTAKAIDVRVEIGGYSSLSGTYSSKNVSFTQQQVTDNRTANSNIFTTTVQLSSPNFTGVVKEPNALWANALAVADAWVELLDSSNQWVTGTNTGSDGKFSLTLDQPVSGTTQYTLIVNPPWNSTKNYSKETYLVDVTSSSILVKVKSNLNAIAVSSGIFPLQLAQSNVTGTVVNTSDIGVANSWVVPIDASTGEYYWQLGSNTKSAGNFAMTLANGSYLIDANIPWGSTGVAKPARCAVQITNGIVSNALGGCIVAAGNSKAVKLALRSPNVKFTMKLGGQPVANANVSLRVGNWSSNAQSGSDGKVAFFIDPVEIKEVSKLSGTQDIQVWVDPPWGTSSMIRWDCRSGDNKPICSDLLDINLDGPTYAAVEKDVSVLGPNTKILIKDPSTNQSVGTGAWVSILYYDTAIPQNGTRWLAGSNTDSNGLAAFNIETITATTKFKVEVNPPWNKRVTLSQKTYDNSGSGYSDSDLKVNGISFELGTPNAVITIKSPTLSDNKWGWIGIEEVNPVNNNFVSWVGGYGLNDTGTAAVTLGASKRFRINANPSSGRAGVPTSCIVETNAQAVLSIVSGSCPQDATLNANNLMFPLSIGNVGGIITYDGKPVGNAIIYAKPSNASDESESIVTTSLEGTGKYGLNLDFQNGTKSWVIKIFPLNAPGATVILDNYTHGTAIAAPNNDLNITLLRKNG